MSKQIEIVKYEDIYREQLVSVWEKSVRATHSFLSPTDFITIKEIVRNIDFNSLDVYCLAEELNVIGFIGVLERKVEMLFLDSDYFGQGLGKRLMDFALTELNATAVDVNEQNKNAVKFYLKHGFKTVERTDKDDHGMDYPLLRMKLGK